MVIRLTDLKRKPILEAPETPGWVTSDVTKKLYETAQRHYSEIASKITNKADLGVRERHIKPRRVALECNVSPSTVTKRRQAALIDFIEKLNSELDLQHDAVAANTNTSGRKPSYAELVRQNKELKAEIERISNLQLAESLGTAIDSITLVNSRSQALTIRKLNEEISRLEQIIHNQAALNQKYIN